MANWLTKLRQMMSPLLLAVGGSILVLVVAVYLASLPSIPVERQDASCNADVSVLQDRAAIELAELRCRVAHNLRLFQDQASYNSWSFEQRAGALRLQLFSTALMQSVVVFVLLFGLAMSYLEFQKGKDSTTTIKIGPANLEVSSTIIGIVILCVSLGFAYLYFDKAYAITEIRAASK